MKRKGARYALVLLMVVLGLLAVAPGSLADDDDGWWFGDDDEEHERYERDDDDHDDDDDEEDEDGRWVFGRDGGVEPVSNETYRTECGACHMAYQPGLLPAASWERIMADLSDHFGDDATLFDPQVEAEITQYLRDNAAEVSRGEHAYRIVRSLDGRTPKRITDVPYIRHEHDEIPPSVFRRKGVRTFSNCAACHTQADNGVYEEDTVRIPRDPPTDAGNTGR